MRFATRAAAAGCTPASHRSDPRSLLIEFYDSRGINIDKTIERKIENNFFREDFRRTAMDDVGVIDFPARVIDGYMEGFYNSIDTEVVKQAGFKVVIDYSYGNSSLVLPLLLGKLGTETVAINAYLDAQKARAAIDDKEELADAALQHRHHAGRRPRHPD